MSENKPTSQATLGRIFAIIMFSLATVAFSVNAYMWLNRWEKIHYANFNSFIIDCDAINSHGEDLICLRYLYDNNEEHYDTYATGTDMCEKSVVVNNTPYFKCRNGIYSLKYYD